MRKYNFTRPLLILVVAFATNMLATNVLIVAGVKQETAGNIGFVLMLIAAFFTFSRLNKQRRR